MVRKRRVIYRESNRSWFFRRDFSLYISYFVSICFGLFATISIIVFIIDFPDGLLELLFILPLTIMVFFLTWTIDKKLKRRKKITISVDNSNIFIAFNEEEFNINQIKRITYHGRYSVLLFELMNGGKEGIYSIEYYTYRDLKELLKTLGRQVTYSKKRPKFKST